MKQDVYAGAQVRCVKKIKKHKKHGVLQRHMLSFA